MGADIKTFYRIMKDFSESEVHVSGSSASAFVLATNGSAIFPQALIRGLQKHRTYLKTSFPSGSRLGFFIGNNAVLQGNLQGVKIPFFNNSSHVSLIPSLASCGSGYCFKEGSSLL